MKRELFGCQISQKSKTEFFSATDLVKAGNKWRVINDMSTFNFSQYLNTQQAKDFIESIEEKYQTKAISKSTKKGIHTWVHPLLFIDIALAINPKLKIEVYEWLFDNLIKFRNESEVSYKRMCGALFTQTTQKTHFYDYISGVVDKIKLACNVQNSWKNATEEQLKLRDKIQDSISLLCEVLSNTDVAVRLAILQTTKIDIDSEVQKTKLIENKKTNARKPDLLVYNRIQKYKASYESNKITPLEISESCFCSITTVCNVMEKYKWKKPQSRRSG